MSLQVHTQFIKNSNSSRRQLFEKPFIKHHIFSYMKLSSPSNISTKILNKEYEEKGQPLLQNYKPLKNLKTVLIHYPNTAGNSSGLGGLGAIEHPTVSLQLANLSLDRLLLE